MDLSIMLNKIRLNDFLSFGPEGIDLELRPLNVIIGPNASGKSNLIQALKILKSAPDKITDPFSEGGGTPEFLWKGKQWAAKDFAGIDVGIKCYEFFYGYKLCFSVDHFGQFKLRNEVINERLEHEKETIEVYYLKGKKGGPHYKGNSIIPTLGFEEDTGNHNEYDFNLNVPILKQFTDYTRYTEVDIIRRVLRKIQIYPGWPSGLEFKPRNPQPVDLDSKFLNDDASNLPGVINKFDNMPGGDKQKLVDCIQKIYPGIKNVTTDVIEHQLYLRFHESGLQSTIPAVRQSDGVLRFLCLLVILLHPDPPPLICLEEPEIGLHPDAIGILGKLLKEAANRTQLIVTTHSDILVSELSDMPESIVICERDDQGTHMKRLDPETFEKWLKEYSIGDLWLRGDIGGTL